jgi:PPK2 family polyphosphate:nucleotide phosphotransferase
MSDDFVQRFRVPPGSSVELGRDYDPGYTGKYASKKEAVDELKEGIARLAQLQDMLYAQNEYALLIILQALDAAGKDSLVKHVMSGLNPQGTQVYSFKAPTTVELDHDYLWRHFKALPERGRIGIFNRSYYEEVLIARVHPELLAESQLPRPLREDDKIWERRFEDINAFERYLTNNGIIVLKIYLNLSRGEQKDRFYRRLDRPDKNWKFSLNDVKERAHWDEYQRAYEDVFRHTSTTWAPWYILPADRKWFTRAAAARIIADTLGQLNLAYPELTKKQRRKLQEGREMLEKEG